MSTTLAAADPQRPGALGVLLSILRRTGWVDVTPDDPYLAGTDAVMLQPARAAGAAGHVPARVAAQDGVLILLTWDFWGVELDRTSWAVITPHNLERALDYIHHAHEAAVTA